MQLLRATFNYLEALSVHIDTDVLIRTAPPSGQTGEAEAV